MNFIQMICVAVMLPMLWSAPAYALWDGACGTACIENARYDYEAGQCDAECMEVLRKYDGLGNPNQDQLPLDPREHPEVYKQDPEQADDDQAQSVSPSGKVPAP